MMYVKCVDTHTRLSSTYTSIEYGDKLSPELLDLFRKILDRNPDTRITMRELRVSCLVVNGSKDQLLTSLCIH